MEMPKEELVTTTTLSPKALAKDVGSPKTPVRSMFEDSSDDSDDIESPNFPHLIPVHSRRNSYDYDMDDVRIGWDDGCGSICYKDDEQDDKNNRNIKRRKRGKLFSERRHRSFSHRFQNSSPSPIRSTINTAQVQAELNDYLGCILSCLSAKKRKRQLMKSKINAAGSSKNDSTENNDINQFLNDNADDDIMFTFSQAIEKKLENDAICKINNITKEKENSVSIDGISPLKNNNTINNNDNNTYHIAKKFKAITTNHINDENTFLNNITDNKDDFSSMFNDCEDDLFSAIDFARIDQQTLSTIEDTTSLSIAPNSNQVLDDQQQNNIYCNKTQFKNTQALITSTSNNNTNSVLWRRSVSSSSIVKRQLQPTSLKPSNDINNSLISNNSKNNGNAVSTKRYCTPAEIEEKKNCARRLLMLKFKSKNKSCS